MNTIEPDERALEAFLTGGDPGEPVVMINLLRYREKAEYPAGFDAEPCSGREAYGRYGNGVVGLIAASGGRMLWAGRVTASVIAPEGESWDDAVLVQYPSREAFFEMVRSEAYQAVSPHRAAGLLDSRLIATSTLADGLATREP